MAKQEEKILGKGWSGLCLVRNYDGAVYFDGTDRDLMRPDATISSKQIDIWPEKWHAFRIHADGTIDAVIFHDVAYSSLLRHLAFDIWQSARLMTAWPMEKWIEYPSRVLIPANSSQRHYNDMLRQMLRFDGIDGSQFAVLDPNLHCKPDRFNTVPDGGMFFREDVESIKKEG
jgi:hypothetical protein